MFCMADHTTTEEIAGGTCEMPCSSRGNDAKTIKKNKDANCKGHKTKYDLNSFHVTGSNQEDEDEDSSPAAQSTQDALISTSYKNSQAVTIMKALDLHASCMIPILVNSKGATPADCWIFSERYHVLTNHSKITEEAVILWGKHCMRWGVHPSPIGKITYK